MTITIDLPEEAVAILRGEAAAPAAAAAATVAVLATVTAPLRMSYEEFLDWLDEDTHAEWVNGEVVMHSPVSLRHNTVGGFLLWAFREFALEHDAGEILYEPFQMKIGEDSPGRSPDIMVVLKENLGRLRPNLLEGPADLIVEIVSTESRGRDRGDKHYEYERGGVREYWLIDTDRHTAEFYPLGDDGKYALAPLDPAGRFHSAVLAGFWLDPAWLWQEKLPTPSAVRCAWEGAR